MKRITAVLGLAVIVAACGRADDSSATIGKTTYTSDEKAGTASISNERGTLSVASGDAAAGTVMPAFAPQYPGSTISSAMVSERDGTTRTNVILVTSDVPEKVAEFYRASFESNGLAVKMNMVRDSTAMVSGETGDKKATVAAARENDETSVTVSFMGE